MFYGDRCGCDKDPSGNSWSIATHQEDVAPKKWQTRREFFESTEAERGFGLSE